jgi:hypothetical protein
MVEPVANCVLDATIANFVEEVTRDVRS